MTLGIETFWNGGKVEDHSEEEDKGGDGEVCPLNVFLV